MLAEYLQQGPVGMYLLKEMIFASILLLLYDLADVDPDC